VELAARRICSESIESIFLLIMFSLKLHKLLPYSTLLGFFNILHALMGVE
jgi:hypothetical protein